MENWIGVGIWIVAGGLVGLIVRVLVPLADEQPGHVPLIIVFGAFGGVIGGMLGVGLFHFYDPRALSIGGFAGAIALAALMTWTYRFGIRKFT